MFGRDPTTWLGKINAISLAYESVIFVTSFLVMAVAVAVRSSSQRKLSRRVFATAVALGPLKPLSLAGASLEMWCDGSNVLAAGDHGTAHFVAISVD